MPDAAIVAVEVERLSGVQDPIAVAAIMGRVAAELQGIEPGPERVERVRDAVLFYGIDPQGIAGDHWEPRWPAAFSAFVRKVDRWVRRTDDWLRDLRIPDYERVPLPTRDDAKRLALNLATGMCACWRTDDEGEPADHQAEQHMARCLRQHRLIAWNRATTTLDDFVGTAIKGGGRGRPNGQGARFDAGGVAQGKYFLSVLRDDYGFIFKDVLLWCCAHELPPREPHRICEPKEHKHHMHEHWPCPACGISFSAHLHRRWVQPRFIVPIDFGGSYEPRQYWKCRNKNCANLYSEQLATCPTCGEPHGPLPSMVWVRSHPQPLEDGLGGPPTQDKNAIVDEFEERLLERLRTEGRVFPSWEELSEVMESDELLRVRVRQLSRQLTGKDEGDA